MTRIAFALLVGFAIVSGPVGAGVLMEMETVNEAGKVQNRIAFRAQDGKIRMDNVGTSDDEEMSTIFLGDEFIVLDHERRQYYVIDQAMLDAVGAKMNEAMRQMEEQLASLPPEQRAMAEKMLKQRMGAATDDAPVPELRVEAAGSGTWQSETCAKYDVYRGSSKEQQVCAADLDDVEGSAEAMEAFRQMAGYLKKMTESLPMRGADTPNPGELIDKIGGFPVITTNYGKGRSGDTTTLQTAETVSLGADVFAAPEGYALKDLMKER